MVFEENFAKERFFCTFSKDNTVKSIYNYFARVLPRTKMNGMGDMANLLCVFNGRHSNYLYIYINRKQVTQGPLLININIQSVKLNLI